MAGSISVSLAELGAGAPQQGVQPSPQRSVTDLEEVLLQQLDQVREELRQTQATMTKLLHRIDQLEHRQVLIRHGYSEGNEDRNVYASVPDNKIPLTELGKQQSHEAGRRLRELIGEESAAFFVSPLARAKETFAEIAKFFPGCQDPANHRYKCREDPRLREQEWGNLQHPETIAEAMELRKQVGRFYYRFPHGESGADVYNRVCLFMDSLFREMESNRPMENFVIVTHGLTIRFLCMRYFRWTVEYFERVWNPENGAMWVWERDANGKYNLVTPIKTDAAEGERQEEFPRVETDFSLASAGSFGSLSGRPCSPCSPAT